MYKLLWSFTLLVCLFSAPQRLLKMVWSRILFKRQQMSRQKMIRFKEKVFQMNEGWLWSMQLSHTGLGSNWCLWKSTGSPCVESGVGAVESGVGSVCPWRRLHSSFPWRALQHWQWQTAGRRPAMGAWQWQTAMGAWPAAVADVSCVYKCNSAWMLMGKANLYKRKQWQGKVFLSLYCTYFLSITGFAVQTMCTSFSPLHMEF